MTRPRDSDEAPESWDEDGYVDITEVVTHLEISEANYFNPFTEDEDETV